MKEVFVNDEINEVAEQVKDFAKDIKDKTLITPYL
jgi:hypothetical protein